MPAVSKKQAIWARLGCRDSEMSPEKCAEFVPHGKGSMRNLPEYKRKIRRKVIGGHG